MLHSLILSILLYILNIYYSENINTIFNEYKEKNSLVFTDGAVPLYRAETIDVPESPKHSNLLGITVQLQVSVQLFLLK